MRITSPSLTFTLSPTKKMVMIAEPVVFIASIHGTGILRGICFDFGDHSPVDLANGSPSCSAGTSLHVEMTVTYRHTYLHPGTHRAILAFRTASKLPHCIITTKTPSTTITV